VKQYGKFAGKVRWRNIDPEITKYIKFGSDEFESFPSTIQNRFLKKATDKYEKELEDKLEHISIYDSFNSEFYHSGVDYRSGLCDSYHPTPPPTPPSTPYPDESNTNNKPHGNSVYYDTTEVYGSAADACGSNVYDNVSDKYYADVADTYVEWYMQNY
jgi:hypothetical protein